MNFHISRSKCCVNVCMCVRVWCLDVNQGETNRNRCTQRLVILLEHTQTYWLGLSTVITCKKPGQSGLLYGSKSPAKNWAWMGIFKPAEPHSPWNDCWVISCTGQRDGRTDGRAAMRDGASNAFHPAADNVMDRKYNLTCRNHKRQVAT